MNPHNHSPHVILYNIMAVTHYKQGVYTKSTLVFSLNTLLTNVYFKTRLVTICSLFNCQIMNRKV